MAHTICPWWLGYWLVSPLRKVLENPRTALGPFVREGMRVLEPGCGMGFYTLDLARLIGERGRVIAVDIQPKMLAGLVRRATSAGLADRIETRKAQPTTLGIADLAGQIDLALALHVVHELPDTAGFFAEICAALKPGGTLLVAEPRGHVSEAAFKASLEKAERAGFRVSGGIPNFRGRTAILLKP